MAILNQAEEVSKRINNLLAPANQQRMLNAFDNVSKAADQIEAIPRQLQPTLAKLPAVAEQTNRALNSVTLLANNLNTLTTTLQGPNGAVVHLTTTLDQMGAVVNKLEVEALPLVNDMRSTLRGFNRTLDTVREHPQSLLLGVKLGEPGPGESGFEAPKK